MAGRLNQWILPAIWASVVFVLCGIPGEHLPEINFWRWLRWDKVGHLVMFGVQSFLLLRAARLVSSSPIGYTKVWALVSLTILYGALMEVLQLTVFSGRSSDVRDAVANGIGAVIGLAVFRFLYKSDYQG
jgi:VanZ family protein